MLVFSTNIRNTVEWTEISKFHSESFVPLVRLPRKEFCLFFLFPTLHTHCTATILIGRLLAGFVRIQQVNILHEFCCPRKLHEYYPNQDNQLSIPKLILTSELSGIALSDHHVHSQSYYQ